MTSNFENVLTRLTKSKFSVNVVYRTKLLIPDVVFFSKGNPVKWFYMDKVFFL